MSRRAVLTVILALASLQALAGAYIGAGESKSGGGQFPQDFVMHGPGYSGAGGTQMVKVCIVPGTPNDTQMVRSMRNAVGRYNALVPTNGNLRLGVDNESPGNFIDFESVLTHELGHCLGLAHPNLASESGLADPQANHTRSTRGANGQFDLGDGPDNVIGSADDDRGDDDNLHWFFVDVNDPFVLPGEPESGSYSLFLLDLPSGDDFTANADRAVGADLGLENTESVMQQGTFADEDQRSLAADDVATLLHARNGLDRADGTGDDYQVELFYDFPISDDPNCQVNLAFTSNAAITEFAVCEVLFTDSGSDGFIVEANAYFNTAYNWYFTLEDNPRPEPDALTVRQGEMSVELEGGALTVLDNDADPEGDGLLVSPQPFFGPDHGTASFGPDGTFVYTHTGADQTPDRFVYRVCGEDGGGEGNECAHQWVTVTVDPPNQPPMATDDTFATDEDTAFGGNVLTNTNPNGADFDTEMDPLTVVDNTSPSLQGVTVSVLANGDFSYDPTGLFEALNQGQALLDDFEYTVDDGFDTADATVTVELTGANDPPTAANLLLASQEDGAPVSSNAPTGDPDTEDDFSTLDYALDDGEVPTGAQVGESAGEITFDPGTALQSLDAGALATLTVPYTVTDARGAMAGADLTIEVTGVNDPPTAADFTVAGVLEDGPSEMMAIPADDADAEDAPATLDYDFDTAEVPAGAMLSESSGIVTFDPGTAFQELANGEMTPLSIPYTATDDRGAQATATLTVEVTGVPDAPIGATDTVRVLTGTSVLIGVLANDVDPDDGLDPASLAIDTPASEGTAMVEGDRIRYTPAPAFEGSDSFTYTVDDVSGLVSAPITVNLVVTPLDHALCAPGGNRAVVGVPLVIDNSIAFAPPVIDYAISGLPASLAFSTASGAITGTPVANDVAGSPYPLTIDANDGAAGQRLEFLLAVDADDDVIHHAGMESSCLLRAD